MVQDQISYRGSAHARGILLLGFSSIQASFTVFLVVKCSVHPSTKLPQQLAGGSDRIFLFL
jgi:hypothetical protein